MDSLRKGMDKIGITRQRLLSQQVTGTRYFFLNLTPHGGGQLRPALGGREHCNPEYAVDRDDYAYEGLEYVAEGTGWVELDGVQHPLAPGTVFAYGKKTRCVIRTNPNQPMVKYFVCLAGTGAAARLQRAGVRPGEMRVLAVHAEMRIVRRPDPRRAATGQIGAGFSGYATGALTAEGRGTHRARSAAG